MPDLWPRKDVLANILADTPPASYQSVTADQGMPGENRMRI